MSNQHGSFVWYELMTSDPGAAAEFYRAVVGWKARDAGQPGVDYRLFSSGSTDVAGLMKLPQGASEPGWVGYVGVDDVDAAVAKVTAAGGGVHVPPTDIPGVGRFAMVADRQGTVFYVMRGDGDGPSESFAPAKQGHCAWNELHTTDWKDALAFYGEQFGWTKAEALDMGPLGTYQLFKPASGDAIGGMMNSPEFPRPAWLFYFNVDDIDAAQQRLTDRGAKVLHGPAEVPGGGWMIQATDPQGAMFALVGPRKA